MDNIPDIVDLVLWLLGTLSVLSWTIMIVKAFIFWRNEAANDRAMEHLERISETQQLNQVASTGQGTFAALALAGTGELRALNSNTSPLDAKDKREMLYHALRQQLHIEKTRLENGLAVLASIGSTSPFIGLFGTVWGIMHALKTISSSGSAGLDVVAGPIGEALIATAMGIAAAIPAVLAYNYFLRKVHLAVTAMEHFADRLLHLAIKSGF